MDPAERRAGDRFHDGPYDLADRVEGQRPDDDLVQALRWQHSCAFEPTAGSVIHALRALGGEYGDRLRVEPSHCIPQRSGRDGIEPLHVVDRQDHRRLSCQVAERAQHATAASERVTVGVECARHGFDVLEQVEEPGHPARQLLLCRPRHEDPVAGGPMPLDAVAPQRRLADPRLAADHEEARPVLDTADERLDATQFAGTANERSLDDRAHRHGSTVSDLRVRAARDT